MYQNISHKTMFKRSILPLCIAALILLTILMAKKIATADSAATDFETFINGNVHGQGGWSKTGVIYDVAVVDNTYGFATFGDKSLRISNAVTSGSFGDQTFSNSLNDEAGESTALNGGMSGGVRQDYFEASWDFASTITTTQQVSLTVTASPDRGDGARMSWIQMADTSTGLAVNFYEYDTTVGDNTQCDNLDNFVLTEVVNDLDRTVPHNIKVTMQFNEGINNDVVQLYIDGVLEHTGKSWEDYFRDCEASESRTVDSLLFRVSGTAVPATSGNGFLIDNVNLVSGQCSINCTAGATTILIDPATAENEGWDFLQETATGSGEFVSGPGAPPIGSGSAQLVVDNTGGVVIGTQTVANVSFADITRLQYSTYQGAAGNPNFVPTLQFNVDYDLTDGNTGWQGRLVFEPTLTGASVVSQTWQTWNALNGAGWWATGSPGNSQCTSGSPCTWAEILAAFPNAGIQSGALSGVMLKAGGGWNGGFSGSVDALTIGINSADTIYNFESCNGTCYKLYLPVIMKN